MSAPGGGGENFDFCEYVYNPLMRQYQQMMRLMQMIQNSQNADCNDIQCFTDQNDPSNPMNSLSQTSPSFFATYGPMLALWAVVVLGLFIFRPNSMRASPQQNDLNKSPNRNSSVNNRFPNNRDNDDDDATIQ